MSPNELASQRWWATAFAGHPYARPPRGTLESVPTITPADLKTFAEVIAFIHDHIQHHLGQVRAAVQGKIWGGRKSVV